MSSHLDPLVVGASPAAAKVLCVFSHGRGQSPEEMIETVISHMRTPDIAFVLPRARGNTWYAAKAVDRLTETSRADLAASLAYLGETIAAARQLVGHHTPLLLGGFSQGACLSLEYALAHGPWRGAMVNLTGCRVGTRDDERPTQDLGGMPVYLTGSDADPWIPVHAFAEAVEVLGRVRARLTAEVFPGRAHLPGASEVAVLDGMLADLAAGRTPFG